MVPARSARARRQRSFVVAVALLLTSLLASTAMATAPARAHAATAAAKPRIGGVAVEGRTIAVAQPSRAGKYAWRRCRVGTTSCVLVPHATGPRYVLGAADIGYAVRASRDTARSAALSNATAKVAPKAPVAVALPSVTGDVAIGRQLGVATGTWTPTGRTLTLDVQWLRCTPLGDCTAVPGATGAAHVVTAADAGMSFAVAVTAHELVRGMGATGAARSATTTTVPFLPVVSVDNRPRVTGVASEATTLHATRGTWSATGAVVTTTTQWVRCPAGAACAPIAGATGDDHLLGADDVGATLRVDVTGVAGPTRVTASSDTSAPVTATTPVVGASPAISPAGAPAIGATLTATTGTWTTPTRRTSRGNGSAARTGGGSGGSSGSSTCTDIAGATGATYVPVVADAGATLRVRVTARHLTTAAVATSSETGVVTGIAPLLVTAPAITGQAVATATLTATNGTWGGGGTPTFTRDWQRCDALGGSCLATGATGLTQATSFTDVGATFRVVVHATNAWGTTTATSAATAPLVDPTPVTTAPPTVDASTLYLGTGGVAHAATGTWTGLAPLAYALQWQRCDAAGTTGSCSDIAGATAADHTIVPGDVGLTLRVRVTATNTAASTTAASAVTVVVAPTPVPVNAALPTVAGVAADTQVLTSTTGTWTGPGVTLARQWTRCDAAGTLASCTAVTGATGASLTLAVADIGSTVRLRVTATNTFGSTVASSAATVVVTGIAPALVTAPAISGQAVATATLTTTNGTWTSGGALSYARDWQRCNALGGACVSTGATGTSLVTTLADAGATFRVVVQATNPWGTTSSTSAATAPLVDPTPVAALAPTVDATNLYFGTGGLAHAATGSWTGQAPITFTLQWQRCDAAGTAASCGDIAGATAADYPIVAGDVGQTLRVRVTATNAAASTTAASAVTAPVAPTPVPVDGALPTTTGAATDGQSLGSTLGSWSGPSITYARQWTRCDATGVVTSCIAIAGATGTSLTLGASDIGSTVRLRVTATNSFGSTVAYSLATAVVAARPPVVGTPGPSISGTARDGQTLTASAGTWTGSATIAFTFQWQRCIVTCSDVAGATGATYLAGVADLGDTLKVVVTATNAGGSASATSAATAAVTAVAPSAGTSLPAITGTAADGQLQSLSNGTWNGTPTITFTAPGTYAWQRCDATGGACVAIAGATTSTYTTTATDIGKTLRGVVRASNAAGAAATPATSAPTAVIISTPVAPALTGPPTVTGTEYEGTTLTAHAATFTGTATIVHAFQWQRCNAALSSCSDIAGATATTYVLATGDVGLRVRVRDTGTNAVGSAAGTSAATATVIHTDPPINTMPPTIAVDPHEQGVTATADPGTWTGTPEITFSYQWQRCALDGTGCTSIAGATESTYDLGAGDVHRTVRLQVHAVSPFGTAVALSDVSSEVAPARIPVNSGLLPAIGMVDGVTIPEQTQTLTATEGGWTGTPPSFAFQWQRCDMFGAACVDRVGETAATYLLTAADVGWTMRVRVTATNAAAPGGVQATSAETPVVILATAPSEHQVMTIEHGPNGTSYVVTPTLPAPDDVEWDGTQVITELYQWQHCTTASAATCTNFGSPEEGLERSFVSADIGFYLRAVPLANNLFHPANVVGTPTNIRGPITTMDVPGNTGPPYIMGTPITGTEDLLGHEGSWDGAGPMTFAFQWQRCASAHTTAASTLAAVDCASITDATEAGYIPLAPDLGSYLRIRVIASNPAGDSAPAYSVTTAVITAGLLPANTVAPAVTGNDSVAGTSVITDEGTWTGTPTITYSYGWQRCNLAGTSCTVINDANGDPEATETYVLHMADVGKKVRSVVTGTNHLGSTVAYSALYPAAGGVLAADPPVPPAGGVTIENTTSPGDDPQAGQTVDVVTGDWTGTSTISFTYAWQQCNAAGTGCIDIADETAASYVVRAVDVGHTLRAVVTATNPAETPVLATSPPTAVVGAGIAPTARTGGAVPTVTDAPERTVVQVATRGDWDGSLPIASDLQWQRCTSADPTSCTDITGATSENYTPLVLDLGDFLRVVNIASNAAGTTSAASAMSLAVVVDGTLPTNDVAPTVTGSTAPGSVLTADHGDWTGTNLATMTWTYQWQQCSAAGTACVDIPGAANDDGTYTTVAADNGHQLRVLVMGHNTIGVSTPVASAPVGPIA